MIHATKRKGSYVIPVVRKDGSVTSLPITFVSTSKPVKLAGKGF
jgi:hypothetical protein